ncbi:MAG TPA: hypothetical protein VGM92_00600, partial [Candidatus Kapabacteria bacterium]
MHPAIPRDWKTRAMPEKHSSITTKRFFNVAEFERIKIGVVPERMEDKWFIYFAEDRLFFHRSWTGVCVYEAYFESSENGATLRSLEVNRRNDEYDGLNDQCEVERANFLIDLLLLGRDVPFPSCEEENAPEALHAWNLAGSAIFRNGQGYDEPGS